MSKNYLPLQRAAQMHSSFTDYQTKVLSNTVNWYEQKNYHFTLTATHSD